MMKDKFIQDGLLLGGLITFQILLWQEVENSWNTAFLGVFIILGGWYIGDKKRSVFTKTLVLFAILSLIFTLIFGTLWSKIAASLTMSMMVGYSQWRIWRFLWIILLLLGRNVIKALKFNLKI